MVGVGFLSWSEISRILWKEICTFTSRQHISHVRSSNWPLSLSSGTPFISIYSEMIWYQGPWKMMYELQIHIVHGTMAPSVVNCQVPSYERAAITIKWQAYPCPVIIQPTISASHPCQCSQCQSWTLYPLLPISYPTLLLIFLAPYFVICSSYCLFHSFIP